MTPSHGGPGPRIGLWGTFDLENFGDMVLARVTRAELLRRVPDADVRVFAPLGYIGLNRFDDGATVEALGRWSPERLVELGSELDCVVIGGGEIVHARDDFLAPHYGIEPEEMVARAPSRFFLEGLGPELEAVRPTVWHAVGIPFDPTPEEATRLRQAAEGRRIVSVRDELSRKRLEDSGVTGPVDLVPDPALLLPRLVTPALVERRLGFLRTVGWYPVDGETLVVQGHRGLVPFAERVASGLAEVVSSRPGLRVVLAETGPSHGDGEFADALARLLPGACRLGPAAGVEDVTAAIASASAFVGSSLHGNIAAVAFRRPHVVLDLRGQSKLEGFSRLIGDPDAAVRDADGLADAVAHALKDGSRVDADALRRRIDAHLDRVAEVALEAAERHEGPAGPSAEATVPATSAPGDPADLAAEARERRLQSERWALADRVRQVELESEGHRGEAERLLFELQRAAGHVREVEARIEELEAAGAEREDRIARQDEELDVLRAEAVALREGLAGRERELSELRSSRTFRYTAPLRAVSGGIRRIRRGGR